MDFIRIPLAVPSLRMTLNLKQARGKTLSQDSYHKKTRNLCRTPVQRYLAADNKIYGKEVSSEYE